MAASMDWGANLNFHKLFLTLRQNLEKVKPEIEAKNILTINNGELFVWNAFNSSILTTNIKLLVGKNETETNFQTLLCTKPPTYDVDRLLFSPTGAYLAVIGKRGVSVLHLPQKWGKYAEFEGGKARILCRTVAVAERYFLSSEECVLHAEWHPGCEDDMHLVLLTSDNTIRIYNLQNPQSAEQTLHLGKSTGVTMTTSSRLRLHTALGEAAIAFDFGPPIEVQTRPRVGQPSSTLTLEEERSYLWPVYVLWGNGDVYVLNTTVDTRSLTRGASHTLQGPLGMYPAAEDNYGSDACSISCLYTRPPTLVIATSEGKLHHCVLLNIQDPDDTQSEFSLGSDSLSSLATKRLYVYETVELELSLTTANVMATGDDTTISNVFSCPIKLHKDTSCEDRYHCLHNAGVHTVALPWLQKIQQFCQEGENLEPPSLSETEHSIVEHQLCTKPLPACAACPVLGLCMTSDRLLGSNLVCLTNTYECMVLPLSNQFKGAPPRPLLSSSSPPVPVTTHLTQLHRQPFDQRIRRILHRAASNPLLKSKGGGELSSQQCLELLCRAIQVFREEYMPKHELARDEIETRIRVLREHKELHLSDLEASHTTRSQLREKAESLAERYEDSRDKHQHILHRVEMVLRKIQSKLPVLTEAEKNMKKELEEMQEKLNRHKTTIQQLERKKTYQDKQISTQASSGVNPVFSNTQSQQLRNVLSQEGDEIAGLMKEVNNLKLSLDT